MACAPAALGDLLEPVQVEAYGSHMPLNQVATVSVPEPRLLSVQVWDKSMVRAVEKAIRDSNLGLNPRPKARCIRLRIPELNEERRKELVKVAHKYAEAARVAVRHVRRDGIDVAQEAGEGREISRGRSQASCRPGAESDRRGDRRDRQDAGDQGKGNPHGLGDARRMSNGRRHAERPMEPADCGVPPAMSRSSWTATAAGRRRADCRAPRAIAAASRRCARTVRAAGELGIRYLTIYSFSSENWSRPAAEIGDLMGLLRRFIRNDLAELHSNGVRVRVIGERDGLEPDICALLDEAEELTRDNDRPHAGGRVQLRLAAGDRPRRARLAQRSRRRQARSRERSRRTRSASISTRRTFPIPISIIRTSGEQRLSNFLLWQAAYSELVFVPVLLARLRQGRARKRDCRIRQPRAPVRRSRSQRPARDQSRS